MDTPGAMMVMGPGHSEEGGSDPVEAHAGAFKRALDKGDPKAIAMAFRAMKQACEEEYGSADDLDV